MVKLSKRLSTAAGMVTIGNSLADIGTDHGYIPIYLVENHLIPKAYAMDIGVGPLERAKEHISEAGLEDYIEVRLSDGVKELRAGEADTVLIAGMGGGIIVKILEEGRHVLPSVKELILSPQSEVEKVREYLLSSGYQIDKEAFLEDGGKYYPILHVVKAEHHADIYTEWELLYGKYPLQTKNLILKEYLQVKKEQFLGIMDRLEKEDTDSAKERINEIKKELELINQASKVIMMG